MSWEDVAVPMLRGVINDMDVPYTYSEDRLEEVLVYAAHFMNEELPFQTSFTITVPQFKIEPDPSLSSTTGGKFFINVMVLKAASIILRGEMKVASAQAYRIVDGPSVIDATSVYKAKKELLDNLLKDLEQIKFKSQIGVGEAVLTPYTQETIANYGLRSNFND